MGKCFLSPEAREDLVIDSQPWRIRLQTAPHGGLESQACADSVDGESGAVRSRLEADAPGLRVDNEILAGFRREEAFTHEFGTVSGRFFK